MHGENLFIIKIINDTSSINANTFMIFQLHFTYNSAEVIIAIKKLSLVPETVN